MAKLVCLLFLAAASSAQTVEGTVTNAVTGGGISGAKVTLVQAGEELYSAACDSAGHFRFEGVKEGSYVPRYGAEGYSFLMAPSSDQAFHVAVGGVPARIEGRLMPLSHVSGRVIDGRGAPVPNASVELTLSSAIMAAETDDKGRFDLDSVFSGKLKWTLAAAPPPDWKPPAPDPETGQPRRWAQTFYPGVGFRDQAAPIVLPAGGNLEGLEIKLLALPVHAIRGVLLRPNGDPAPRVTLALGAGGLGRTAADHAESKADGSFEFPAVVDGTWRLSADLPSGAGNLRATEWLEMAGRDRDGVKLRLGPPFSLGGTVILETPQGMTAPRHPGVGLTGMHAGRLISVFQTVFPNVSDDIFRIDNVYPGTYQIDPARAPRPYYLDSIRLGDTAVHGDVELSAGSPELTVVYKANGGTVRGTVEKCGTAKVWLLPKEGFRRELFEAACDASGRFEFTALRPGEYYALAVPSYEWGPDNMDAALIQAATRITVRAGETTQVDLTGAQQ